MPNVSLYLRPDQDEKLESLKNHFNVRSKTDVLMRIIEEYLNNKSFDKEKKPTK